MEHAGRGTVAPTRRLADEGRPLQFGSDLGKLCAGAGESGRLLSVLPIAIAFSVAQQKVGAEACCAGMQMGHQACETWPRR